MILYEVDSFKKLNYEFIQDNEKFIFWRCTPLGTFTKILVFKNDYSVKKICGNLLTEKTMDSTFQKNEIFAVYKFIKNLERVKENVIERHD